MLEIYHPNGTVICIGACLLLSVGMVSGQEEDMDLSKLKRLEAFPVRVEGDIYTAPFSQKSCVWFEWIRIRNMSRPDRGNRGGYGTECESESSITIKSKFGDLTARPQNIMLYLAPSFDGKTIVDGKEQHIKEFCLEPNRRYYASVEKFTYRLPPFRFFRFIPIRRTAWLLALSDERFEKGRPTQQLIPTRQGGQGSSQPRNSCKFLGVEQ
jgi:hypothetical protein